MPLKNALNKIARTLQDEQGRMKVRTHKRCEWQSGFESRGFIIDKNGRCRQWYSEGNDQNDGYDCETGTEC